jgi:phage repressor protein C with HTH and peptisase S24 domain
MAAFKHASSEDCNTLNPAPFSVLNMATLAERITKARETAGLSKSDLARAAEVSASAVTQWENGETKTLSGETLMRLAVALSVDPGWLATGKGGEAPRPLIVSEMNSTSAYRTNTPYGAAVVIPVYSAVGSMGPGHALVEHETVIGGMQLSESWVGRNLSGVSSVGNLSVISAIGESMTPTFNDGDILLVDRGVFELKMDAVYVLAKNDELFIKRVHRKLGGGVVIKSDNPLHGEEHIENPEAVGLRILGRVVWAWNGKRL